MFLVGLLSWWYGRGFVETLQRMKRLILRTYDLFSIDILTRTLFVPFRQIVAPENNSWIAKVIDGFISRGVGFFIRISMVIIGSVVLILAVVYSVCVAFGWLLLPLVPFIAAICYALGVSIW